jgi:hypothetical protein
LIVKPLDVGAVRHLPHVITHGRLTGENAMRAILALSLLITLTAAADAATVHHRRHAVANPTQVFTPGVRSGYAYAPDGPAAPYNEYNEPYFGASQGYAPGEKERFLNSVRSGG